MIEASEAVPLQVTKVFLDHTRKVIFKSSHSSSNIKMHLGLSTSRKQSVLSEFNSSRLNKGARRMEIGFIKVCNPMIVVLYSERFPIWIFSLQVSWCLRLFIVGYASLSEFYLLFTNGEKAILELLLAPFVKQNVLSFCESYETVSDMNNKEALILVSGGLLSYLVPYVSKFPNNKLMGVVDSHWGGRLRKGRPTSNNCQDVDRLNQLKYTKWHRLKHTTTGGPTEFVALFEYTNISFNPPASLLQRGIRHVFNASIRPGPPPNTLPSNQFGIYYSIDDRLCPGLYHLPVLCPTHFHSSGTGYRILSNDELATAHGFTRNVVLPSFPRHLLEYPPCQLLSAGLEPIWDVNVVPDCAENPRPSKRPKDLTTWIPALQKHLSHDWIDISLITATASKSDDAALPCQLWNYRMELLFPGCLSKLETIRQFLIQVMRRRLLREIRLYMVTQFGTSWSSLLCLQRYREVPGSPKEQLRGIDTVSGTDATQQYKLLFRTKSIHSNNSTLSADSPCHKLVSNTESTLRLALNQNRKRCGLRSYVADSDGNTTPVTSNLSNSNVVAELNITTTNAAKRICVRKTVKTTDTKFKTPIPKHILERLLLEGDKVTDVLEKICLASWWEWDAGSSLFFWRWGEEIRLARDGMIPFLTSQLPHSTRKGRSLCNDKNINKITEKLATILKRGYIQSGNVKSLIDFFAVPKGNDIRLVYNGSSCGLNEATWAPNFWLPYPRTAIRLLDYDFYSVDIDFGEMFLNFPLHESIRPYSGIDLTPYQEKLGIGIGKSSVWYRWTRNWMGARLSPYSSVQFCSLAEEFCRGNNIDATNPLRWDVIVLNLPGSANYDPSKHRVYKWDRTSLSMAGELVIFVDDVRATGRTVELVWQIARQICSRIQYLGVQDAARKRKPPTKTPGAWAGAVFATTVDTITKTVTQEKWDKARTIISTLNLKLQVGGVEAKLGYKELEVARGFLCHLSMTYEVLVPFLKGFHLILASHLPQRNDDGWKLSDKAWASYMFLKNEVNNINEVTEINSIFGTGADMKPPDFVTASDHLRKKLIALAAFVERDTPPIINDRSANVRIVRYGFGDASGTGFGSTIQTKLGLKYRVGVWGSDEDDESSNFKELENVVSTIEEEALSGNLDDAALFFFTDNTTVEAALYKGNSSSHKLFQLVVRFRKIQLVYGTQVIVSHVSGKRMIDQGTDGVSRGNMKEGVGSGIEMLQYIPLHQGALERYPPLEEWIKAWGGKEVEFLTPMDWFVRGHDHYGGTTDIAGFWRIITKPGIFVWSPPPAAAEAAIEQLRRALIKRQRSTHIFVCPRLLTTEWLKQLYKAADIVVSLPAGSDDRAWPAPMYEPLTIAFIFPLLSFKPWKRKRTPKMFHMVRTLSGMWKERNVDSRNILREFFDTQKKLSDMPEGMVRKVLYFQQ